MKGNLVVVYPFMIGLTLSKMLTTLRPTSTITKCTVNIVNCTSTQLEFDVSVINHFTSSTLQYLYRIELIIAPLSWRRFRKQPATRCFDESFAAKHIKRTICTSATKVPSTAVSRSFRTYVLRSTPFGYRDNNFHVAFASGYITSLLQYISTKYFYLIIINGLLRPCFKTGRSNDL